MPRKSAYPSSRPALRLARQRQRDLEARAAARLVRGDDPAAMLVDDLVADREPKADAAAGLRREERLEDVVEVIGGDPGARVVYCHGDRGGAGERCRDRDRATPLHRLRGVEEEIEEYLLHLARIAENDRALVSLMLQCDGFPKAIVLELEKRLFERRIDRKSRTGGIVRAREAGQFPGEEQQSPGVLRNLRDALPTHRARYPALRLQDLHDRA